MSLKELSQYAPEILELLTTGVPKRIGQSKSQVSPKEEGDGSEAGEVNICQISDSAYSEETIKETAHHIVRSLEKDEERAKQLLIWIQNAISSEELRDPEKPGSTYLNAFLKKDKFILKPYDLLLPSSLRKLGSVFAGITHIPKNPSKFNTYAREALQHLPDNHVSPSDMIKQIHSTSLIKTNHI
ncbi:hypothetical protein RhiirA1_476552 [Rhizophagus irregularis]|uniref:Uncharacterized protein n=1 Tax=Rhizophagus irregularis TaxID=588596 RepID=A0A2I1FC80_9GLOM|nr:hypothetical protein RhiirA1_476552 [Rhizophagus irregularis]PKY32005.1 hypothetical protein RhiirB3_449903 [Rhizophagus irregularis]